jgi:hypothetical protein
MGIEAYVEGHGYRRDYNAAVEVLRFGPRSWTVKSMAGQAKLGAGTWFFSEDRALADLMREVFGNPFRPVEIDASWRTTNVVALAQAFYEERAFERMPILGDALEESGCDNTGILNHCRQPGEHVRGCWVVDQVLGKS